MSQENPYAAPEGAGSVRGPQGGLFGDSPGGLVRRFTRSPIGLTKVLIVLLWIGLVLGAISLLSTFMELQLLSQGGFTEEEGQTNDLRQAAVGITELGAYIVTAIVFLKWIYRASLNVHGFGARGLAFTPGWAIGWYFVPFLNLVRPFQAMKEIWQASHDPGHWQVQPGSPLVGWWWGLWLLSGFAGQLSMRLAIMGNTIDDLIRNAWVSIATDVIGIIVTVVAIVLIKRITRAQVAWVSGGDAKDGETYGPNLGEWR